MNTTFPNFRMHGEAKNMYAIQSCTYDSPYDVEEDVWVTLPELFLTEKEAKDFVLASQKIKGHHLNKYKKYQIVLRRDVFVPSSIRYINDDVELTKEEFVALQEYIDAAMRKAAAEAYTAFVGSRNQK